MEWKSESGMMCAVLGASETSLMRLVLFDMSGPQVSELTVSPVVEQS